MMKELTQENYYEDREYLSNSQFKKFMKCQAKALAIQDGEWTEAQDETPLLLGNYVHSFFESEEAHQKFLDDNADKLISKAGKTKGQLKKDFLIGDSMIDALKDDEAFNKLYHGQPSDQVEKEMIVYGEIEGVPFKGKLDTVNLTKKYFADLKTMKSIHSIEWSQDLKMKVPASVNNILGFGYHGQMAVYRELLKQMTGEEFRPIIVAVSKEDVPDKELIRIDEVWLEEGLDFIKENIKEVWGVINYEIKPKACGCCDYCRSQKKLGHITTLNDLISEGI